MKFTIDTVNQTVEFHNNIELNDIINLFTVHNIPKSFKIIATKVEIRESTKSNNPFKDIVSTPYKPFDWYCKTYDHPNTVVMFS